MTCCGEKKSEKSAKFRVWDEVPEGRTLEIPEFLYNTIEDKPRAVSVLKVRLIRSSFDRILAGDGQTDTGQ